MPSDGIGDNREFGVPDISDVTVYFFNDDTPVKTSANDTATEKYCNNNGARASWQLRTDQIAQIVSINNITLTDPITVPKDGSATEKDLFAVGFRYAVSRMVIRTTVVNTNLKLRGRG